jgi:hypothetical protein
MGGQWDVTCYFHNPNIHPFTEWRRRLGVLEAYSRSAGVALVVDGGYPLEQNLSALLAGRPRCAACLAGRLGETARMAAEMGIGVFSTTLSVSPYIDHGLLNAAGSVAADRHGVEFRYMDLRGSYPLSVRLSREAGMYRQKYCGCIMSERDRYRAKTSDIDENRV